MTHAHKNTMIARMGFADTDREAPDHDLICQFVAASAPDVIRPIFSANDVEIQRPRLEYPLSKGNGPYRTTVGFLDVVLPFTYDLTGTLTDLQGKTTTTAYAVPCALIVEVKSVVRSVHDVMRQLAFYREYEHELRERFAFFPRESRLRWALATPSQLSARDAETLKNEGFLYLHIGERFHAWKQCVAVAGKPSVQL